MPLAQCSYVETLWGMRRFVEKRYSCEANMADIPTWDVWAGSIRHDSEDESVHAYQR